MTMTLVLSIMLLQYCVYGAECGILKGWFSLIMRPLIDIIYTLCLVTTYDFSTVRQMDPSRLILNVFSIFVICLCNTIHPLALSYRLAVPRRSTDRTWPLELASSVLVVGCIKHNRDFVFVEFALRFYFLCLGYGALKYILPRTCIQTRTGQPWSVAQFSTCHLLCRINTVKLVNKDHSMDYRNVAFIHMWSLHVDLIAWKAYIPGDL